MVGFLWGFRNVERTKTSQRAELVAGGGQGPSPPSTRGPHYAAGTSLVRSVPPARGVEDRHQPGLGRGETPTPPKARRGTDGAGKVENRLGLGRAETEESNHRLIQSQACGSQSVSPRPAPHGPTEILHPSLQNPYTQSRSQDQRRGTGRLASWPCWGGGEGRGQAGWEPWGPFSLAAREAKGTGRGRFTRAPDSLFMSRQR